MVIIHRQTLTGNLPQAKIRPANILTGISPPGNIRPAKLKPAIAFSPWKGRPEIFSKWVLINLSNPMRHPAPLLVDPLLTKNLDTAGPRCAYLYYSKFLSQKNDSIFLFRYFVIGRTRLSTGIPLLTK